MKQITQGFRDRLPSGPLSVVGLFAGLTEVAMGFAVWQTTGGIQIALTLFSVLFPVAIAGGFFWVLVSKPQAFYRPREFGPEVDPEKFARAMEGGGERRAAVAKPESGVDDSPSGTPEVAGDPVEDGPTETKRDKPDPWALLNERSYVEALSALQGFYSDAGKSQRLRMTAFFHYEALTKGFGESLAKLRDVADAHPDTTEPLFWLARAEEEVGDLDGALLTIDRLLASSQQGVERTSAILTKVQILVRQEKSEEALSMLGRELGETLAPGQRARLYKKMAAVFKAVEDQLRALAALELAVQSNPGDTGTRFELAHEYSTSDAEAMALHHYRELPLAVPDHEGASNNAGVAAERLSLPCTSVHFYSKAMDDGSALAAGNLALAFVRGGHLKEAEQILEDARAKELSDDQLLKAGGDIAKVRNEEKAKLKSLDRKAKRAEDWMRRLAPALLGEAVDPGDLLGNYTGKQIRLELINDDEGRIKGSLTRNQGMSLSIGGSVTGNAFRFWWTEKKTGEQVYYPPPKKGHGILVSEDGGLRGFYTESEAPLKVETHENFQELALEKAEA